MNKQQKLNDLANRIIQADEAIEIARKEWLLSQKQMNNSFRRKLEAEKLKIKLRNERNTLLNQSEQEANNE